MEMVQIAQRRQADDMKYAEKKTKQMHTFNGLAGKKKSQTINVTRKCKSDTLNEKAQHRMMDAVFL